MILNVSVIPISRNIVEKQNLTGYVIILILFMNFVLLSMYKFGVVLKN